MRDCVVAGLAEAGAVESPEQAPRNALAASRVRREILERAIVGMRIGPLEPRGLFRVEKEYVRPVGALDQMHPAPDPTPVVPKQRLVTALPLAMPRPPLAH
jgi:hypothetical protein